jgi:hypothetical protein
MSEQVMAQIWRFTVNNNFQIAAAALDPFAAVRAAKKHQ